MSEKRPTVRDLAKEAGVSIATVSRFLNQDHSSMSDVTRQRLAEVVNDMGYVNPRARPDPTVGLVLPNITDPFFAATVESVSTALEGAGYVVQLCLTYDSMEKEERCIQKLLSPGISGIVYMSTVMSKDNCNDSLKAARKPFVVLDSYLSEYNAPAFVFSNGVYAMYEATEHLLHQGHRDIGYLSGIRYGMFEHHRYQGHVNCLLDAGIEVNPRLVRFVGFDVADGLAGFQDLYQSGERFTAIICESDLLAAGVYKGCYRAGLRVPDDLSVVGFNNSLVSTLLEPALTSVDQQMDLLAETAVQMLQKQIHGENLVNRTERIPSKLVLRESVKNLSLDFEG